jgi:hypothetical protein
LAVKDGAVKLVGLGIPFDPQLRYYVSLRNGGEAVIFNAVLKNPKHEEYDKAAVPFPIPPNEYEPIRDMSSAKGHLAWTN